MPLSAPEHGIGAAILARIKATAACVQEIAQFPIARQKNATIARHRSEAIAALRGMKHSVRYGAANHCSITC